MRTLLTALLMLTAAAPAAGSDPCEILAALCDTASPEFEKDLQKALIARLPHSLSLADALATGTRTDRGRAVVARIVQHCVAPLRERAARDARAIAEVLPTLSDRMRQVLKMEALPDGRLVVSFEARTFAGPDRLRILEYLVCPELENSKSYECLAGMSPTEWEAFGRLWKPDRTLLVRWSGVKGAPHRVPLVDLLPWARPDMQPGTGLKIGGNHDESKNAALPPDCICLLLGVVLP